MTAPFGAPAPFGTPTSAVPGPGAGITAVRGDRGDGQWAAQSRSELVARHGVVTSSHAVASQIGVRALEQGGTAADAAIAAAAALAAVEPESAGPGGDMMALYYDAATRRVHALDGTGWSPSAWTPAYFARLGHGAAMPRDGVHSVTVPGAVSGWWRLHERFGRLGFGGLLEPAIALAEQGFGVSELVHRDWQGSVGVLARDPDSAATFLVDGHAPPLYGLFRNPGLAHTLRRLQQGPDTFYQGDIGKALVAKVEAAGGAMTRDDLAAYEAEWVEPVSTRYHGYDVHQAPPSTQGFAALEMLNILDASGVDLAALGPRSPAFWHHLVEAKKLAFADLNTYGADPRTADVPLDRLLSAGHAADLAARISPDRAAPPAARISHDGGTVYLAAADRWGNMVSFICSVANGNFGSGVTVPGHGFVLHSRGIMFSADPAHPNAAGPRKRPFTTIIPAFVTRAGRPVLAFGNMGGNMQAQAQVTELVNMIDLGMNVQAASDAARFLHDQATGRLDLESELYALVGADLAALGHDVHPANGAAMGGYQAVHFTPIPGERPPAAGDITGDPPAAGVYRAAADHRKDGSAAGW